MYSFFNVLLVLTVFSNVCQVHALKCYQCSSFDDKKCGDPFSAKDTLAECPTPFVYLGSFSNNTEPILCRKLKQTIQDHVRITRACGFISDNRTSGPGAKSCFRKAFSGFTSSVFCDCAEDECNMGNRVGTNFILMLATICVAVKFCFN